MTRRWRVTIGALRDHLVECDLYDKAKAVACGRTDGNAPFDPRAFYKAASLREVFFNRVGAADDV